MNTYYSLNRLKLFFPLFVALSLLSTANASVLNFDELAAPPSGSTNLPANYGGFKWDFGYLRYDFLYPSGYYYGAVSKPNIAYSHSGFTDSSMNGSVSLETGTFNFNGVYLGAGWNENLNIKVEGYLNTDLKYVSNVTVGLWASIWFDANYQNINKLVFSSSGGNSSGLNEPGYFATHFFLDNFTYNEPINPVPIPGSVYLFCTGLFTLAAIRIRLGST